MMSKRSNQEQRRYGMGEEQTDRTSAPEGQSAGGGPEEQGRPVVEPGEQTVDRDQSGSLGGEADRGATETGAGGESGDAAALQRQLEELRQDRDELYGRLQRVSADYQNYMRRSQANLADSIDLEKADLLKQFIPVLDHFDNALATEVTSDDAKALHDGVKMVRDELLRVLANNGAERIDVEVGDPFDPEQHEAVMRQAVEGVKPNHVSMFMQPGYRYRGRTLRPAKVAVAPED
jgi:molecular chaperone GrpE